MSEFATAHPLRGGLVVPDEGWVSLSSSPEAHARMLGALDDRRTALPEQWDDSAIAGPPLRLQCRPSAPGVDRT